MKYLLILLFLFSTQGFSKVKLNLEKSFCLKVLEKGKILSSSGGPRTNRGIYKIIYKKKYYVVMDNMIDGEYIDVKCGSIPME